MRHKTIELDEAAAELRRLGYRVRDERSYPRQVIGTLDVGLRRAMVCVGGVNAVMLTVRDGLQTQRVEMVERSTPRAGKHVAFGVKDAVGRASALARELGAR